VDMHDKALHIVWALPE